LTETGPKEPSFGPCYWNFVPEIGSKVIPLKDYQPGKKALRIYNLPGKLVPEDQEQNK
jgi:hypothetical protein